jgi:hypothetical protein
MMQILAQRNVDAYNFNGFYTSQNPCQLFADSNCVNLLVKQRRIIKDLLASNQRQRHLTKNNQP